MNILKEYLAPVYKWWWLVATAPIIAAISAFIFVRQLPPVYQARTTLLIGRAFQDPNPSTSEFGLSYQLAGEYANVANREPVRDATKAVLGVSELPKYEATSRGIFLEIAVIHTDPAFAMAVANELAKQIIKISPASIQASSLEEQQFVQDQLVDLQKNIEKTRNEISSKQETLTKLDSALEISETENDLSTLEEKLATLQSLFASLLSSTHEAAFNTISVFEPATQPTIPVGPNRTLIILLAAFSGLAFAVGAVYVIEFMDDTVKTSQDVSKILDIPVIGYISSMTDPKTSYVADAPRSQIADAFRSLRTNLEFSSVDHPLKRIVITSVEASDGKTTVAINLAMVIAQADRNVILVDADLRSPSIHEYLGLPGNPGLSDIFLNRIGPCDALKKWSKDERLSILPAGPVPPNPAELLGSMKMDQILDEISDKTDTLIIDAPPAFVVDALVLTAKADGVILVVNSGETHRGALKAVVEQLRRLGANLVGIVLNRVPRSVGYYGRYYYSSYYSDDEKVKEKPNFLSRLKRKKDNIETLTPQVAEILSETVVETKTRSRKKLRDAIPELESSPSQKMDLSPVETLPTVGIAVKTTQTRRNTPGRKRKTDVVPLQTSPAGPLDSSPVDTVLAVGKTAKAKEIKPGTVKRGRKPGPRKVLKVDIENQEPVQK